MNDLEYAVNMACPNLAEDILAMIGNPIELAKQNELMLSWLKELKTEIALAVSNGQTECELSVASLTKKSRGRLRNYLQDTLKMSIISSNASDSFYIRW